MLTAKGKMISRISPPTKSFFHLFAVLFWNWDARRDEEEIPFNGQSYELLYYKQLSGYVEHITPPHLLICSNYQNGGRDRGDAAKIT